MNKIIWLLTILTCILFYFLGQRSVVIPKCEPMTEVRVWILKEQTRKLPATGVLSTNQ